MVWSDGKNSNTGPSKGPQPLSQALSQYLNNNLNTIQLLLSCRSLLLPHLHLLETLVVLQDEPIFLLSLFLKSYSDQPFPTLGRRCTYLWKAIYPFWSVPFLASEYEQIQTAVQYAKIEELQPTFLSRSGSCYWFPKQRVCDHLLYDKSISKDSGLKGNPMVRKHELVVYC